ncbi:MAG: Aerobic respiration control sensor protein ArcB [Pseudomonadota bacterium]|jgi:signal transduction histidine kinase/HPt (histidine-containing phosphotransfer) domain-containing protein/ActR/RegA family two-component response regulator
MWDLPDLAHWQRGRWIKVIAGVLAVMLTPLGWIQWQQFQLLRDVATNQVDSIMWQAYQLERELSRLDAQLHQAVNKPAQVDPYELAERYEVFLSRITLLTEMPRRDLIDGTPAFQHAMTAIDAFVALADPLFVEPDALMNNSTQLAVLESTVTTLLPPVADLTREANRAVARFVDERNQQLQQQSSLIISLVSVQIAVMLTFVLLLVHQIRRQQQQYARLQKLSQELAFARDQANAANHGKSVFLANMSHEIRTPFQGLLGMLTLMEQPNLTTQQRDYLHTARDSAQHLLGLLNDILDVSTIESGTLKLAETAVNVRQLVQDVQNLMQVSAGNKGLSLDMTVDEAVPEWLLADATRVRQILYNLINNAIKFTQHGGVQARVSAAPADQVGVVLTVQDSGIGMDSETLEQLFTRFFQADNSLRRRIGGTGLGLEISRKLARMMGGDIEVSSTLGVGSVFTVTLHLPEAAPGEADTQPATAPTGPTRRLKMLVAEDHPTNLKFMAILLDKMGHDAVFCENGAEALDWLGRQRFDVVLLDYHMPVLDGMATTEAIRQMSPPLGDIKVVLVTADVVNDTRQRAKRIGVNEFVSKPLQASDLQRALQRCGLLEAPTAPPTPTTPSPQPDHAPETPTTVQPTPDNPPAAPVVAPVTAPVATPAVVSHETASDAAPAPVLADDALSDAQLAEVLNTAAYDEIAGMLPPEDVQEMVDSLLAPPQGTLHVLVAALQAGDVENTVFAAHSLKGTALLMGFKRIAETAAHIEQLGRRTPQDLSPDLITPLQEQLTVTQQALRQYRTGGGTAG